jgi:hypothetical protein
VIDIDPDLAAAGGGHGPERLRLDVDDPVGTWAPLCDALEGMPTPSVPLSPESRPRALSEPVVAPGGLVFRCDGGDGPALARAWADSLAAAGVVRGRLRANPYPAGREAELEGRAAASAWVVAWMVPRLVAGVDFGYRPMRGWRVRRFPRARLDRLVAFTGARDAPVAVVSSGGGFEVLGHDLASYAGQWLDHGVVTASVLGAGGPAAVLVTTARRGAEMVGVGRAAEGLADDAEQAGELLGELTELVLELAGELAYAVVGVHESGAEAARGAPFREAVPATARAQHSGLSLGVLDQWVLDAGPVQLLTPHHRVTARDVVDESPVKGGELRLVRIGRAADWFSGPERRAQVRNRGRDALAACLPPRRTPLPQPLL